MKIHEYQAKELFRRYGLAVPEGRVAKTVDEAMAAWSDLKSPLCVVKAQIHAGGRGKAGGVKLVRSADECRAECGDHGDVGEALVGGDRGGSEAVEDGVKPVEDGDGEGGGGGPAVGGGAGG